MNDIHPAHRERRQRLLREWADGIAVLPTHPEQRRNGDSDHPYRCDSDFYYLTGFTEPESILVLAPGRDEGEEILFLRPRDPERETWDGRRLGVDRAPEVLGVQEAYPIAEFPAKLPELLAGRRNLHYRFGVHADLDRLVLATLQKQRFKPQQRTPAPDHISDPGLALHEMRLFKDDEEMARMRRAAVITGIAHAAAAREAADGKYEYEVQAALEYEFRRHGAIGPAYGSIVASGANATVLHYHENDRRMQDSELLLIDAGAEWRYYAADLTRTYPIGGRYTAAQRAVYDLVLAAQKAAIDCVRAGRAYDQYHEAGLNVIVEGLRDLGWLPGTVEEILESASYRRFFMHKSGHWLGLDVHDAGRYHETGTQMRALEPGMVLTVEPGIYVGAEDETVPEEFRGIGVRIEDDVLVTPGEPEILTPQVPKEPDEVEELMGGA